MPDDRFRVTAIALNLRSEARVARTNRVAVLPQRHPVTKLAVAANPAWWRIATELDGTAVEGFVAHRFLEPADEVEPLPERRGIVPAHLSEGRADITRRRNGGWAHPIGEADRPGRPASGTAAQKTAALGTIVRYLAVDDPAHRRYKRQGSTTFCNVYAHDYCYLAGVYLPRVWWTNSALISLATGGTVTPAWGETVLELNANSLYDWLRDLGPDFGWQRIFDLTELQDAANAGEVCVICAQRTQLDRPGHIAAVVPETGQHAAKRIGDEVTTPLQSQAGWTNWQYGGDRWWLGSQFRGSGFWRHG